MCPVSGTLRKQGYRDTGCHVSDTLLGPVPAAGWAWVSSRARGSGRVQQSIVDTWTCLAGVSPSLPRGPCGEAGKRFATEEHGGAAGLEGRLGSGKTTGAPGKESGLRRNGPTRAWTPDFQPPGRESGTSAVLCPSPASTVTHQPGPSACRGRDSVSSIHPPLRQSPCGQRGLHVRPYPVPGRPRAGGHNAPDVDERRHLRSEGLKDLWKPRCRPGRQSRGGDADLVPQRPRGERKLMQMLKRAWVPGLHTCTGHHAEDLES